MRLTNLGRGLAIGGLALVVAGLTLGQPAVLAVGTFVLALVGCAALLVAEVPDVSVARAAFPTEVDRGGPAEIRLMFRSMSTRRPRHLTVVESVDGRQRIATIGPITAQGTDHISYAVPTARRGLITAGPLVVRRYDPFGLVTADRRFTSTCTVSVRPRRYALRMLPSGRQRDLEGPTRERSEGSASFHQLREYVPGDDLRRIHWRSTARTGELLVKEMIDTTRPELLVVLDNRRSAIGDDDFENAVDIAASIVRAAEDEDFPTTLMFANGEGDVDIDGQPIPAVDRLTSVQLGDEDSLAQLADVIVSRGRSLVFVTGEPSASDLATLAKLAVGFRPAYLVSVVAERHDPIVAPRGMRALACADPEEFVGLWRTRCIVNRPLVHVVGPVVLAAMSGLALWRASVPGDLALGVLGGVIAGTVAGWLIVRPLDGVAGMAIRVLAAGAALAAGVVAITQDVGSPTDVPHHVSTFLSIGLPADGLDDLAVVPYVATATTVALAAWAALRSRALAAVLVAAAGFVAAALLAAPVGVPLLVAAAFCVVLTGVLMATSRFDYSELEPLVGTSTAIRRNQRWWRPGMVALPAVGVAVASLVIPTPSPYDVRHWVASDIVTAVDENPLAVAARFVADPPRGADEPDVAVSVEGASPGRLRLAVLDDYSPEGWHQLAEYSVTGTHLAASVVDESRPGPAGVESRVVLTDRPGRSGLAALPTAGMPLELVDATGLRYSADAGLLLPVGGEAWSDVTYTVEPSPAPPAGEFGRPPAGIGRAVSTCPGSELIRGIAHQLTGDVADPRQRLAVIETWLKFQHLYVPDASGGQTLASVERFLGRDFGVGNLEVFVTAYALLARCAGVPVRVVVGYPAPAGDDVTEFASTDLSAWVETPLDGVGWVAFDPVPTPAEQERIREEIGNRNEPEPGEVPAEVTTTTVPLQAPSAPSTTDWGRRVIVTVAALLVVLGALATWSFVTRRRTIGRRARVADPATTTLLAWTTLLERFGDNRQRLGAHLTASETARATSGRVPAPVTRMMGELAAVVDRARFDGEHTTGDDARLAWALADESLARLPEGWPVWSGPLRHPGRTIARLRLTSGMARNRRRWTGEVPASAAALDPETRPEIDGYDAIARIGVGATAAVYRAVQAGTGRTVAIKVFSVDAGGRQFDRQRFLWEARVAETVSGQPHLPEVLGSGFTVNGQPYLVTKFYESGTLARHVRIGGPMAVPKVEVLARQLATALDTLHKSGVLHGDVKPENVFVDDDGSVVLGDLGAGWLRADGGPATVLTPAYAAPEVWIGHTPTVRSDIYSLGLTLLFAVTGVPPVPGTTPTTDEVVSAFESDIAVPLFEVDPRRRPRMAADVANRFGAELAQHRADAGFTLPPPSWTVRS